MDMSNMTGAPLITAFIVVGAIAILVGISITFQGSVQF